MHAPQTITSRHLVRIPLKPISHSGGKPITVPGGNRSGVGVKRRWHFDVAKTDRNRQVESIRSEAKAGWSWRGWGQGASVPCPASARSDPERWRARSAAFQIRRESPPPLSIRQIKGRAISSIVPTVRADAGPHVLASQSQSPAILGGVGRVTVNRTQQNPPSVAVTKHQTGVVVRLKLKLNACFGILAVEFQLWTIITDARSDLAAPLSAGVHKNHQTSLWRLGGNLRITVRPPITQKPTSTNDLEALRADGGWADLKRVVNHASDKTTADGSHSYNGVFLNSCLNSCRVHHTSIRHRRCSEVPISLDAAG
jgi:hypothetical protein